MAAHGQGPAALTAEASERRRQQEMAAQFQRMFAASPALAAQFGDKFGALAAPEAEAEAPPAPPPPRPQPPPRTPGPAGAGGCAPSWRVLADRGGVVVRAGRGAGSPQKNQRLAGGSRVRGLELQGERLRYELLEGSGPKSGWVSISVDGRAVLLPEGDGAGSMEAQRGQAAPTPGTARQTARAEGPTDQASASVPALGDLLADLDEAAAAARGAEEDRGVEVPSLEAVLAILDGDQEEDRQWESSMVSRQRFFQLGATAAAPEPPAPRGPAPGRGHDFSFAAIQERGRDFVRALAEAGPGPPPGPEAGPEAEAGRARAAPGGPGERPGERLGGAGGGGGSLRERLQRPTSGLLGPGRRGERRP